MSAPLCPSCGQPASEALAGPDHGWECRNEACPEFGQPVAADEPPRPEAPAPRRDSLRAEAVTSRLGRNVGRPR